VSRGSTRPSRWQHFWFEPALPTRLGFARAIFFACLFAAYLGEDFSAWGDVDRAFWMPMPAFAALHLAPAAPAALQALEAAWRIALAASALGVFTRASMIVSFVLGFYLLGLPHNFGHTYHFDALLVITLGILACSRAGDAFALRPARVRRVRSGEYTWPIRAVWVMMALVFLAAGLAKLRHGGLAWIASPTMSIVLTRAAYHVSDADPITGLGLWIAAHEWLSRTLAATALVIELGFVSALFSRRARTIFVPAAFAMLVGIRVLMGPTFGAFLVANVFWVPWERVPAWVPLLWLAPRRLLAGRPRHVGHVGSERGAVGPGAQPGAVGAQPKVVARRVDELRPKLVDARK